MLVSLGDFQLAVETFGQTSDGDRPWVTLAHALGASSRMWGLQIESLTPRYRVLCIDARGHGVSEAPSGEYRFEELAEDVVGVWDQLGIETSHFIGLSMGGMTGMGLGIAHKSRLRSLVLCDTAATVETDPTAHRERIRVVQAQGVPSQADATLERWLSDATRANHPEREQLVREMLTECRPAGYIGCCHALAALDFSAGLGSIECAALVVVGSDDPGTPPSVARRIHESIDGSRYVEIEGARHLSNLDAPDAFNAVMVDWLESDPAV